MKKELLAKVLGNVTAVEVKKTTSSKNNIESRKKVWVEAVKDFDVDKLLDIQDEMEKYVDNLQLSNIDTNEISLTKTQALGLMKEYDSGKEITEFLAARKAMIKDVVFQVINETLAEDGVDDPENTNGSLEIPELGKRFAREGSGYKEPTLDIAMLKNILGDKASQFVTTKIIPERRVEELDEDLLVQAASNDPEVLEALKNSVVPGTAKTPRLQIRNI